MNIRIENWILLAAYVGALAFVLFIAALVADYIIQPIIDRRAGRHAVFTDEHEHNHL